MGYINVDVKHNGTNISNLVLSYSRNKDICTSVGTASITILDTSRSFDPWDIIEIYELGRIRDLLYISSVSDSAKDGSRTISCQDSSKRLTDYFIADDYLIDYVSYTGYWIGKFMDEAGVPHSAIPLGVIINPNTSLGLTMAYDVIMSLLQQSGWHMYFDEAGTAIVGDISSMARSTYSLGNDEILNVETRKTDSILRNRAVTWGGTNPLTGEWIFADLSISTPWNYDANDKRAVVLANSNILTFETANEMCRRLLSTLAVLTYEKEITFAGSNGIGIGDLASVHSKGYTGIGRVTAEKSEFSKNGLVTTVILDQQCPRIVGMWDYVNDWVYIGTESSGVWRKPILCSGVVESGIGLSYEWEAFNSGLEGIADSMYITDLYINEGIYGTTTYSGEFFYQTVASGDVWFESVPSGLYDINSTTYWSGETFAKGVTINHDTNALIVGFDLYSPDGTIDHSNELPEGGAWVVEFDSYDMSQLSTSQIYVEPSGEAIKEYDLFILDIDNNDINNVLSVAHPTATSGIYGPIYPGDQAVQQQNQADNSMECGTDEVGYIWKAPLSSNIKGFRLPFGLKPNTFIKENNYLYFIYNTRYVIINLLDGTYESIYYASGSDVILSAQVLFARKHDTSFNTIQIVARQYENDTTLYPDGKKYEVKFYELSLSTHIVTYISGYTYNNLRNLNYITYKERLNNNTFYFFVRSGTGKSVLVYSTFGTSSYTEVFDIHNSHEFTNGVLFFDSEFENLTGTQTTTATLLDTVNVSHATFSDTVTDSERGSYSIYKYKAVSFMRSAIQRNGEYKGTYRTTIEVKKGTAKLTTRRLWIVFQGNITGVGLHIMWSGDENEMTPAEIAAQDAMRQSSFSRSDSTLYGLGNADGTGGTDYCTFDPTLFTKQADLDYTYDRYAYNTDTDYDKIISFREELVGSNYNYYVRAINKTTGIANEYELPRETYKTSRLNYGTAYLSNIIIKWGSTSAWVWLIGGMDIPSVTYDYYIVKQVSEDKSVFSTILESTYPYHVEISKQSPTMIYTYKTDLNLFPPLLGVSHTLESGSFTIIEPILSGVLVPSGISCVRAFDVVIPSGFYVYSGVDDFNALGSGNVTESGMRYIGYTFYNEIDYIGENLDTNIGIIDLFSGVSTQVETTNNSLTPFFFIATSGEQLSGEPPNHFLQRNVNESIFMDYTSGMPLSRVTIIRLDDMI